MTNIKKGLSPVVSTILLILITIAAVVLIAGFAIPFVRNNLDESKVCFDASEQLKINTEEEITCHSVVNKNVSIQISRGTKELDIRGFFLVLSGGGSSKTFEIYNGKDLRIEGIEMLDGTNELDIPKIGEDRTYNISLELTPLSEATDIRAKIAPIMPSGVNCPETDNAKIPKC